MMLCVFRKNLTRPAAAAAAAAVAMFSVMGLPSMRGNFVEEGGIAVEGLRMKNDKVDTQDCRMKLRRIIHINSYSSDVLETDQLAVHQKTYKECKKFLSQHDLLKENALGSLQSLWKRAFAKTIEESKFDAALKMLEDKKKIIFDDDDGLLRREYESVAFNKIDLVPFKEGEYVCKLVEKNGKVVAGNYWYSLQAIHDSCEAAESRRGIVNLPEAPEMSCIKTLQKCIDDKTEFSYDLIEAKDLKSEKKLLKWGEAELKKKMKNEKGQKALTELLKDSTLSELDTCLNNCWLNSEKEVLLLVDEISNWNQRVPERAQNQECERIKPSLLELLMIVVLLYLNWLVWIK